MERLPKIRKQLSHALEYFEPISRKIHPEMEEGDIINKTIDLTHDWLDIEAHKATELFYEKKGIKLHG